MKNSGVEWIGKIPESWEINRIKFISTYNDEIIAEKIDPDTEIEYVDIGSVSFERGIEKVEKYDFKTAPSRARRITRKGDIIISTVRTYLKAITMVERDGLIVSTGFCVLRPDKILNRFVEYFCKSQFFTDNVARYSVGINYPAINASDLVSIRICQPPKKVQQKIADFLDDKCAKIDSLIAHEEATIEELKAYKQSVITEAVTKGLDKSVPMKDSGVELIGEIPESWEIKKAKFLADMFSKGSGITKEDIVPDGDSPCVRYGEIYTKYDTYFKSCVTRTNLSNVSSPQYFSYGDILFVCTGELVEEIGKNIVYLGNERCLAGGDIIVMKHSHNPLYLSFALNSHISQYQKSCNKAKLKVVHISLGDIGNLLVAVPPLKEQKQIAEYLDKKCACIDSLALSKQNKIEELKEYKKSLIYEYVTGKKEVA